jgi:hypothetical protein
MDLMEKVGLSTLSSRGIKACGESVRLLETSNQGAVSEKQEETSNTKMLDLSRFL